MVSFLAVMDTSGAVLIGIFSSIIHEMGHLSASYFLGYKVRNINLGCVNADIILNIAQFTDKLIIALSGPLVNLAIALIFKLLYVYLSKDMYNVVSFQNLCIGLLNLIPISSFDGGQVLFTILNEKFNINQSEKVLNIISVIFIIPIFIIGFLMLFVSKYNFSLLLLACYLIAYTIFKENIF